MYEQEPKAFKWVEDRIEIYGDVEGKDVLVAIPKRLFDQMVETLFNVEVSQ